MINKLRVLGEYVYKNEGDKNALGLNLALKEANVIVLNFSINNDNCVFTELDTMEFDQTKNMKILYRNAKARAKSPFPTYSAFYDKDEEKCRNNISKSFNKFNTTLENNAKINSDLDPLVNYFNNDDNLQKVKNAIYENLSADKSNLFTIRLNDRFIGESEFFKPIIRKYEESIDQEYYLKYNTQSLGENETCYICGNISENLYGFCDTFKFYSANEAAYIAGGFQREVSWKNYPVCPQCAKYLRLGREKVNKNFNRYFYGNRYFLIPSPIINGKSFENLIQDIEEDLKDLSLSKEKENNQQIRTEMEEYVFDTLAKQKNQATFTFFFYTSSNSEFKIIYEAEDILPSRFQKIINAKKKVEENEEFKNLKGLYEKGLSHNLTFNFGIIKTFFPSNFNNDFLDITTKVFKGQRISKTVILHQISEHISKGFRNERLYYDIEKAMILMKFLYELKLIETPQHKMEVKMDNKYEDYFKKHPEFYDADWKKAVFLTGVLSQHVMDIQWKERGAVPFRSRLNGLKLDHRAIKRLLPEAIEKLEQYKSNFYRELEEVIARLMEIGEPELRQQSVDEISFYFAIGLNSNKQFKSKKQKELEGEINE